MTSPAWFYDDMRQVGVDFEDDDQVASYDERQQETAADDNRLLDQLGLGSDQVFADIGCGTGILLVEAARRCRHVHGVDVSAPMLAHAKKRAAGEGIESITFHHAGFLSVDLDETSVDLITSKYALHHLPDFWKGMALERLHRALKPGGRLFLRDVVFSATPAEFPSVADAWTAWMHTNTGYAADEIAGHIRDEHSTYAWIMEGLIRTAGFRLVEATYAERAYGDFIAIKDS